MQRRDDEVVGWALGPRGATHDWLQIESLVHRRDCDAEVGEGLELTDEGRFRVTFGECGSSSPEGSPSAGFDNFETIHNLQ